MAYVHDRGVAHLDVKPGNLVCTNDFRLQIIDFNTAVGVASEDHMVEGVYDGIEGWMVPEIQEGVVFSPIRADQWSCGKTFVWFFAKGGVGDDGLKGFAKDLMNKNPARRSSLI